VSTATVSMPARRRASVAPRPGVAEWPAGKHTATTRAIACPHSGGGDAADPMGGRPIGRRQAVTAERHKTTLAREVADERVKRHPTPASGDIQNRTTHMRQTATRSVVAADQGAYTQFRATTL
jgi:hypothetical protein